MPEQSRRVYATQNLHIAKVANVPASYAYEWLTDYRPDDGRFSSSRPRFRVVKLAKDRVLRTRLSHSKRGTPPIAVELVRLRPPDSWHVDQIDETDLAAVDYRVSPLGRGRSRIVLRITERWMTPNHPSLSEYRKSTAAFWDRLVEALEERYNSGKPAIG